VTIKLCCRDYGFDCEFVVGGEVESVINQFGKHAEEEHGIEYTKEVLMQLILRKTR
jgi:predicted small metal-binding protein